MVMCHCIWTYTYPLQGRKCYWTKKQDRTLLHLPIDSLECCRSTVDSYQDFVYFFYLNYQTFEDFVSWKLATYYHLLMPLNEVLFQISSRQYLLPPEFVQDIHSFKILIHPGLKVDYKMHYWLKIVPVVLQLFYSPQDDKINGMWVPCFNMRFYALVISS